MRGLVRADSYSSDPTRDRGSQVSEDNLYDAGDNVSNFCTGMGRFIGWGSIYGGAPTTAGVLIDVSSFVANDCKAILTEMHFIRSSGNLQICVGSKNGHIEDWALNYETVYQTDHLETTLTKDKKFYVWVRGAGIVNSVQLRIVKEYV